MLTIPRTTKREETSYDRAIAKASAMLADPEWLVVMPGQPLRL
jgi:hypothetical protein